MVVVGLLGGVGFNGGGCVDGGGLVDAPQIALLTQRFFFSSASWG